MTGYLDDELRHLDLLLRRACTRFERDWGAVQTHQGIYIAAEEADHLLHGHSDPAPDELDAQIAASRARLDRAAGDEPLYRLAARLGLSEDERQILIACLAPELDRRYDRIYAYLQDDLTRRRPSVDLVTALVSTGRRDRWDALRWLAPQATLLAAGILRVVDDPASPSGSSALARLLQVAPSVVACLLGRIEVDPVLARAARIVTPGPVLADDRPAHLMLLHERAGRRVIQVHGPAGAGKADLARTLTAALGRTHLEVSCPALPDDRAEAVRAALRDGWLNELPVLLLDADDVLPLLDDPLARFPDLVLVTGDQPWPAGGAVHRLHLEPPARPDRERLWRTALDGSGLPVEPEWAAVLADQLRLYPGQIRAVAAEVRDAALARDPAVAGLDDWLTVARRRAGHRLERLGRRVRLGRDWDDLVLEPDRIALLHEICDQVRLRDLVLGEWRMAELTGVSRGLSVMFAGPPGTGKTMAAGVVARELGRELFAIDLSQVVSKYIGETEKNLAEVFTAAEDSGAVLLFDEADALFGTRTEIGDAHDRYANIEISFLLQRIEEYDGVAILATNLRQNLDEAFLRRLRFVVDFPLPDTGHRRRIWAGHLAEPVPLNGVDLDLLAASMPVAGGSIRNITLAAGFLAAATGAPVGMDHLVGAARREFEKLGKLWRDPRAGVTR